MCRNTPAYKLTEYVMMPFREPTPAKRVEFAIATFALCAALPFLGAAYAIQNGVRALAGLPAKGLGE